MICALRKAAWSLGLRVMVVQARLALHIRGCCIKVLRN